MYALEENAIGPSARLVTQPERGRYESAEDETKARKFEESNPSLGLPQSRMCQRG